MKLYVDTGSKQVSVTKEATEKLEQNGRQKVERGTGRPMWSTQVFVLDDDGGEVITVTTAGEKPNVKVGRQSGDRVQAGGPAVGAGGQGLGVAQILITATRA